MTGSCIVSQKCQSEAEIFPSIPLDCKNGDFECLCSKANSMGANAYYSAHCVFAECAPYEKRVFLSSYIKGCQAIDEDLSDIPTEWLPFAPSPQHSTSLQVSSTSLVLTRSTKASSTTTSSASTTNMTTQDTPAQPLITMMTTSLADLQIPICGIATKCMKSNDDHKPMCSPDDLDCICDTSNSFANNTQFDQQCVFDSCIGDIGLREFLENFIYHCSKYKKQLVDVPPRWAVYLPDTASSYPTSPASDSTASPQSPLQSSERITDLSDGEIAGIAVGSLVALVSFIWVIILWRRQQKKNRRLTTENAKLTDAASKEGFSARIYNIMNSSGITMATNHTPALMDEGGPVSHKEHAEVQTQYGDHLRSQDAYRHIPYDHGHAQDDEIRPGTPRPDVPKWQNPDY
ncbi:hypothetical protein ACN47E_004648 [Coniothyrium glycines]